jgi:hypothetical protein
MRVMTSVPAAESALLRRYLPATPLSSISGMSATVMVRMMAMGGLARMQ